MPADQLVPGDVVILEDGNLIPADLRLSHIAQLQVNEASLTGESQPVDKISSDLDDVELAIADRLNVVYKGTVVTRGRGEGIVTAIGM